MTYFILDLGFSKVFFSSYVAGILDLKPEVLQAALNVSGVGALVASQEVSLNE